MLNPVFRSVAPQTPKTKNGRQHDAGGRFFSAGALIYQAACLDALAMLSSTTLRTSSATS